MKIINQTQTRRAEMVFIIDFVHRARTQGLSRIKAKFRNFEHIRDVPNYDHPWRNEDDLLNTSIINTKCLVYKLAEDDFKQRNSFYQVKQKL